MIAHLLRRNVPPLYRVTCLAIWPHLPAVNVRVAVGAILSHIREQRLRVALHAFHLFVHATQRIFRFVVVEFRDRADRPPSGSGVAVLTGNVQRAVGTAFRVILAGNCVGCRCREAMKSGKFSGAGEGQQCPERELEIRVRRVLPFGDKDTDCWAMLKISNNFPGNRGLPLLFARTVVEQLRPVSFG